MAHDDPHLSNDTIRRATGAEWDRLVTSASETQKRFRDWYSVLEDQVKERPGPAVATAVGAGFALGGGIFTPFAFRIARLSVSLAARAAAGAWALRALTRLAEREHPRRPVVVPS